MHNSASSKAPPDQAERSRALDPTRSFLVQAPAGSGKTHLLTQRFLRLLGQAERPDEIVAITFTNAAAAEMRHRILQELEKAEAVGESTSGADPESLAALAYRALVHSKRMGWSLLDQPGQLRITTIDAFCRSLALQCPLNWGLLSGLGGRLDPVEDARDLYRQAARRTLEQLSPAMAAADPRTARAVEELLLWRDNYWKDVEDLLVEMLGQRNRWFQDFVFDREPDWDLLRDRLEAPFRRTVRARLEELCGLLHHASDHRDSALSLAQFACANLSNRSHLGFTELAELPSVFQVEAGVEEATVLEDGAAVYREFANFLLTRDGAWRKPGGLNVNHGFPPSADGKSAKARFGAMMDELRERESLRAALAAFQQPMPVRYTDEEWSLIRHCFAVLRAAAAQLQVVFAEAGSVDFTEIAQIALRVLISDGTGAAETDGFPSDFALRQADSIRHLLIDEFQDTSRNQHQLLSRLIAAWPEREGRSCFCVGDPMQSIYGFREAEVELFERLKTHGLELVSPDPSTTAYPFEFVSLRANFRTEPSLVEDLNGHFQRIFAEDDGSGVRFSPAEPARAPHLQARTELHLAFTRNGKACLPDSLVGESDLTRQEQLDEIVRLIRDWLADARQMQALATPNAPAAKFRIAVLARTGKSLVRIAEALRLAGIGFRAIDLVPLSKRPEVLDALSLARALLNPVDRTAWLAVLRAPWCGLSLEELHRITSADDTEVLSTPISVLLEARLPELERQGLISGHAFRSALRVARILSIAVRMRDSSAGSALGTWLESIWKALGGDATVDAEQRQNLDLLWAALDRLPEGELDLLGPGLNAALDKLHALPDPAASSDFGVQLMTIHKSKGLEFEVVLVPDLEAEGRSHGRTMISWLERGLTSSDSASGGDPDEPLTEFLIAPIQSKGATASAAKSWVDRVKRERDTQEIRRILYVAATRARQELHLFARPRFREALDRDGSITRILAKPGGLLATAWPALHEEVEARFSDWAAGLADAAATEVNVVTLAAEAASSNLLRMQPARKPPVTILKRLPEDFAGPEFPRRASIPTKHDSDELRTDPEQAELYSRTKGGLESRLTGLAIHSFLEELTQLRAVLDPENAAKSLTGALPGIAAALRGKGLPLRSAETLANEALAVARRAATDPVGAWIMAPHAHAQAESRWTGMIPNPDGRDQQRDLRPDRVFLASAMPVLDLPTEMPSLFEERVWWIIDYKTSHAGSVNLHDPDARESFLTTHRAQYRDQLAAYARLLPHILRAVPRMSQAEKAIFTIRAGIYYPRAGLFDFWEVEP